MGAWSLFSQSGVDPKSWATSVLQAGGWPVTNANLQSLIAWAINEGGGGQYNPLNTTQGAGTNFNSVGVKNFSSWQAGVTATVQTINNGYYPNIQAGFQTGVGIGPSASHDLQTWSGSGYSSISSAWNRAGGYLGGAVAPLPSGGGGGGGGGSTGSPSIFTDVWNWVQGTAEGTADVVTAPFDIGKAIASLGVPFTKFVTKIDWLFHPSHWIRIIAFGGGVLLVLGGVRGMMRVGQGPQSVPILTSQTGLTAPTTALPVSILLVGSGGILLFIAFHNVPDDVQNFQQLVGWVLGGVFHASTPAQQSAAAAAGQVGAQDPSTGGAQLGQAVQGAVGAIQGAS